MPITFHMASENAEVGVGASDCRQLSLLTCLSFHFASPLSSGRCSVALHKGLFAAGFEEHVAFYKVTEHSDGGQWETIEMKIWNHIMLISCSCPPFRSNNHTDSLSISFAARFYLTAIHSSLLRSDIFKSTSNQNTCIAASDYRYDLCDIESICQHVRIHHCLVYVPIQCTVYVHDIHMSVESAYVYHTYTRTHTLTHTHIYRYTYIHTYM